MLIWEQDQGGKRLDFIVSRKHIKNYTIPNKTSPATAISWKLWLKVSFILATKFRRVGSQFPYVIFYKNQVT